MVHVARIAPLARIGLFSVTAALAIGGLSGDAGAQLQLPRTAHPAAPSPPANTGARAPVAPPPPPTPSAAPGATKQAPVPPGVQKRGLAPNRSYVPFPTGMTNTVDSKVCSQHGGFGAGLACTAGLPSGMLALVWNCLNCTVDGYRVFRVDGGRREPVAIPANGSAVTAALLDAPQGGFVGRCYAALAYRGTNESELSNAYCASGGSVMNTVTDNLAPDHVRSSMAWTMNSLVPAFVSGAFLDVGGFHASYKLATGDDYRNELARGGLHFDLTRMAKKHVLSAKLHVKVDTTKLDSGGVDHSTSCTSAIALGRDEWWSQTDWILAAGQTDERSAFAFDTPARLKPGSADGPEAVYDVTPIVTDWVQGTQKNYGFVLMTEDSGIHGFSSNACKTTYTPSISLEVTYW
jgi:hypothetical protein